MTLFKTFSCLLLLIEVFFAEEKKLLAQKSMTTVAQTSPKKTQKDEWKETLFLKKISKLLAQKQWQSLKKHFFQNAKEMSSSTLEQCLRMLVDEVSSLWGKPWESEKNKERAVLFLVPFLKGTELSELRTSLSKSIVTTLFNFEKIKAIMPFARALKNKTVTDFVCRSMIRHFSERQDDKMLQSLSKNSQFRPYRDELLGALALSFARKNDTKQAITTLRRVSSSEKRDKALLDLSDLLFQNHDLSLNDLAVIKNIFSNKHSASLFFFKYFDSLIDKGHLEHLTDIFQGKNFKNWNAQTLLKKSLLKLILKRLFVALLKKKNDLLLWNVLAIAQKSFSQENSFIDAMLKQTFFYALKNKDRILAQKTLSKIKSAHLQQELSQKLKAIQT